MSQDAQDLLQTLSDVMFPSAPETRVKIDSVGYDGDTALHVVAWRNDLEAVRLLLVAGADPNAVGEMDETPLHISVHHGNAEMARVLIAAGARVDMRCEFGDTAAERAASQGGEIAAVLVNATPPSTSLERSRDR